MKDNINDLYAVYEDEICDYVFEKYSDSDSQAIIEFATHIYGWNAETMDNIIYYLSGTEDDLRSVIDLLLEEEEEEV